MFPDLLRLAALLLVGATSGLLWREIALRRRRAAATWEQIEEPTVTGDEPEPDLGPWWEPWVERSQHSVFERPVLDDDGLAIVIDLALHERRAAVAEHDEELSAGDRPVRVLSPTAGR